MMDKLYLAAWVAYHDDEALAYSEWEQTFKKWGELCGDVNYKKLSILERKKAQEHTALADHYASLLNEET